MFTHDRLSAQSALDRSPLGACCGGKQLPAALEEERVGRYCSDS